MRRTNGDTIRNRRQSSSFSAALSVSLGLEQNSNRSLHNQNSSASHSNDFAHLGRSYVSASMSTSPAKVMSTRDSADLLPRSKQHSRLIAESSAIHKETAKLSNDFNYTTIDEENIPQYMQLLDNDDALTGDDISRGETPRPFTGQLDVTQSNDESDEQTALYQLTPAISLPSDTITDYEIQNGNMAQYQSITDFSSGANGISSNTSQKITLMKIMNYLPASILGLLLNILDALSYGMIIFPITEPVFASLGPSGISMFYISTIICQAILSGGFSAFPCGLGSEMIEITPFYHTMALSIKNSLPGRNNEIITTTIFCYVISSMLTGLVFYTLGKLKLGKIVGFFPRHILIGSIGGVGYFLLITGIEVTTRVPAFEYSWDFVSSLFANYNIMGKWMIPIVLTIILIKTQKHFQNSLVLPSFYIVTFIAFHFIVAILPNLSLEKLRDSGWIFPMADSTSSWYDHYKYFKISDVSWMLVIKQIPTMLALTFFGILHVPINVPALAISMNVDKYDVDRELIAHGYSNFISGLAGSVQNYLVYTNSVLFIRAGADSSVAGYLLILLTIIVMIIGPIIVSLIPICIVASLIFLLGYELLIEALVDTLGKVTTFEYATIVIIVLTMGIYDFVVGIIVGILIACFSFMVDETKLQTINAEYDGKIARSTVYRDYVQTKFLNEIREQIYLLKLQNVLFFGTIISIEEKIDKLLEISEKDFIKRRIKYLILDFKNINADNIDYSAAEGFNRIKRFTESKNIQLIISSISSTDQIYQVFNRVQLLCDVELFNDLNSALEWCENKFLYQYKQLHEKLEASANQEKEQVGKITTINYTNSSSSSNPSANGYQPPLTLPTNTPRHHQLISVAQNLMKTEASTATKLENHAHSKSPLIPLLLHSMRLFRPNIFSEDKKISDREVSFWTQLAPYFTRSVLTANSKFNDSSNYFFVIESGVVKITHKLLQGRLFETMLSRTCFGELTIRQKTIKSSRYVDFVTETDTAIWMICSDSLSKMRQENIELYTELVLLIMAIREYRFKGLIGYSLVSA